jgi:putative ABC transport system ATP-binding protein
MITVENLNKSFFQNQNQISILKNLSLQVNAGEVIGLVGQSGSGKTTFLTLMSGLEKPDTGKILVNDTDLVKLSEEQLTQFRAKNISIVFQQYHLISHLTALENVMLPLEVMGISQQEAKERALNLLNEVGLANRVEHFPSQLSGGESQRVAIARALVTTPKVIYADEPSGNLDQETGAKVMSLFMSIVKKYQITTLLVTHNLELAGLCQKVYKLQNGHFEKIK